MIKQLLTDSFNSIQLEVEKGEQAKCGVLRGGSCCCKVNGVYFGECPRIAQLRYRGVTHSITQESDLVFNLGYAHETQVLSKLLVNDKVRTIVVPELTYQFQVNHPKLVVGNKLESDISVYKWSGSPDFIVQLQDNTTFGIETKSLASSSSASKVYTTQAPYSKAVLQSAMYSYVSGIPFYILYGLYHYTGTYKQKINPFLAEFKVEFDNEDSPITIVKEDGTKDLTIFSIRGILDGYIDIASSDKVLPRVTEHESFSTYVRCAYCDRKDSCESYDLGILNDEQFLSGE